jgi:BMFP domain-containing protein YqiC
MFYIFYTMLNKEELQKLSNKIRNIIKESPISDAEDNINALLQGMFTKLELINREEFDVQTGVLKRTREKLEAMEEKLEALEAKLGK